MHIYPLIQMLNLQRFQIISVSYKNVPSMVRINSFLQILLNSLYTLFGICVHPSKDPYLYAYYHGSKLLNTPIHL